MTKLSKSDVLYEFITSLKNISNFFDELLSSEEIEGNKGNICLVELGVGSIDYVSIISDFQDKYDIKLSVERFVNVNKLDDVVEIIYQEITSKR